MEQSEPKKGFEEIEKLIAELDEVAPAAREKAVELTRLVLEFHAAALERMIGVIRGFPEVSEGILRQFAADDLIAHVLLLHGLHPEDVEGRVRSALDRVRPYLQTHGGDAQLLSVSDGVVRLSLDGSCKGCPSSAATLKLAIEKAIYEAAPEITEIVREENSLADIPFLNIERPVGGPGGE